MNSFRIVIDAALLIVLARDIRDDLLDDRTALRDLKRVSRDPDKHVTVAAKCGDGLPVNRLDRVQFVLHCQS